MARALLKSRELVNFAYGSFTSVKESVCKEFPVYKHPSLSSYLLVDGVKACREDWLKQITRLQRDGWIMHLPHMVGFRPSVAKTVSTSSPSFGPSKVDVRGFLTDSRNVQGVVFREFRKVSSSGSFTSPSRSFSTATRAAWSRLGSRVKSVQSANRGNLASGRRFYHTDGEGVQHFKARGPRAWLERPQGGYLSDRRVIVVIVLASGFAFIYYTHLEIVPYTHRKHFVLLPPDSEIQIGENEFENLKKQWRREMLPPIHPATIRVHRVAERIIESVMSAVGLGQRQWGGLHHGVHKHADPLYLGPGGGSPERVLHSHADPVDVYGDEYLDEEWVEQSREKGLQKGQEPDLGHIKLMKWEIIVVDLPVLNAMCLPGGKIVVFTGLLNKFPSDAEIATVLGHEIAHAVARHVGEKLTQAVWLGFLKLTALVFFNMPAIINDISDLLIALPYSRKMEMEADHIGLILMAASGYNPVVAPSFYEKLGKFEKTPEYLQYLSTHPSGKKRGESLRDSETMKRAILLYEERLQGHLDLRRFL